MGEQEPELTGAARLLSRASLSPRGRRRLELLAIVLPLVFLAAVDAARGVLLHGAPGHVFFYALVAGAVVVFSHAVFKVVGALHERVVDQNEHLTALNRVVSALAETSALQPLLSAALDAVTDALPADAAVVCAVDVERGEHSIVAARGFSEELVQSVQRASICDDPIAFEVVMTGRTVVRERLRDDPRIAELATREGVRSAMSAPLKSNREIVGILAVATASERRFEHADRKLVENVAGQLGTAFQRAAAVERLVQRNREMEAILTVSGAVTSSLALADVLDGALTAILDVTSADAAEVWLTDGQGLALAGQRGAAVASLHGKTCLGYGEGLPGHVLRRRRPLAVHDLSGNPRYAGHIIGRAGFESYYAVPLVRDKAALGVLGVAARDADALTAHDELRLLAGVGEVIAVGVENARLLEQVQDAAVLEERERIAREMHDGLAQVLTYLNAQLLAVGKLLAVGDVDGASHELSEMEEPVRSVYADVREAILGLRSSPHANGELIPNLRQYLESFEDATGLETRLLVDEGAATATLSPSAEIQLMRILQEALSNVRKHARARSVTIDFEVVRERLRVRVVDDGLGFDPNKLRPHGWPRFGLQTMRERAEAVGGTFRILSHPAEGTTLEVELTLAQPLAVNADREPAVTGAGL